MRFAGMQTRTDGSYYMFGSCALSVGQEDDPVVRADQPWDVARALETSIYPDTDGTSRLTADSGPLCRSRGYRRVGIHNWYLFPAQGVTVGEVAAAEADREVLLGLAFAETSVVG